MLHAYEWNAQEIINKYKENANEVLVFSRVKPRVASVQAGSSRVACAVCANTPPLHKFSALACGHYFCNDCWAMHFEVQIMQGNFSLSLVHLLIFIYTMFDIIVHSLFNLECVLFTG